MGSPGDSIKRTDLLLWQNCALIQGPHFSETGETRGKINANLYGEQRQQPWEGTPLCRWLYRDLAETLTHPDMKAARLGWLHKLQWAPAAASSLGHKTDSASHKLDCVRPERCLALVHRSWGLEGWNTKRQTMMSSIRLSSQSRLEYWKPRRSDYIIPVRLETAFSQPNLQTQSDRALRDAAKMTQRAAQLRKLCIDVEWLTLEEELFIASINQSVYWQMNTISTKVQAL